MRSSKAAFGVKFVIRIALISLFLACVVLIAVIKPVNAAPPYLSAQNPPVQNSQDQRCANEASGNNGLIGWSLPLSAVQIVGSNWGEVTYRTYVCNGSNTAITRDVTMTRGRGTIVNAPPAGNDAIGSTDVLDYSGTGWGFSSPWYSQEMGSYSPHSWRYQDVTFRIDGSKFPVSGNYTVRVTGKGVVYYGSGGRGETNEVDMNIQLTIIKTNPSNCTVTSSPMGVITPGQNVQLTFQVTNGGNLPGTIDWDTNQYRLGLKPDSTILSQKTVGLTPDIGNSLRMNRTSISSISFNAPSTPGAYTLSWELQNVDGTWYDDILDNCNITINVGTNTTPDAFSCTTGFYQIANGSLYSIAPTTGQASLIANTGYRWLNAVGYNRIDNYMYGVVRRTTSPPNPPAPGEGHLIKIGSDGSAVSLGAVPSSPNTIAGDMDAQGNLWYIPDPALNKIIRLNVQTRAYTEYTLSLPAALTVSDLVYIGGSLYGIQSQYGRVVRIPTSGFPGTQIPVTISGSSPITGLTPAGSGGAYQMTSAWTSETGSMYTYQIGTNKIFEILNYNSGNPSAIQRSPGFVGDQSNTDGASCPNAPDPYLSKANRPYLRVQGSDVIAGAVFADSSNTCDERRDAFDPNKGYIKANGSRTHPYNATDLDGIKNGSSSAQYAAFAYGVIDSGNTGNGSSFIANNGYYRSNLFRDILFANTLIGTQQEYGKYYKKNSLPCVDVSRQQAALSSATTVTTTTLSQAITPGDNSNLISNGDITLSGIILPAGTRVMLYVDGKVTIANNILYAGISSDSNGILTTPSFTVIATGGIDILPATTYLDGYFLATNNSTINTCAGGVMVVTSCNSQLRVNGALSAKNIEWRRNYGTLGTQAQTLPNANNSHCAVGSESDAIAITAPDGFSQMVTPLNKCAAEFINFNPAFYFANPFATQTGDGVSSRPLNTTELPPVY